MKSKFTSIKSGYFLGIDGAICASLLTYFAIAPLAFGIAIRTPSVLAQIIPDNTLGAETSVVTPINTQFKQIEGGAIRGSNLFHSFSEFNVGNGQSVYFVNPVTIENIFSRVTGNNPSHILSKLGVFGNANLFLLNPNGILFGENAQLDIRGSFVATTADSFVFDHGWEFSASNPDVPPLLSVNVPIGLQYGGKPPADIINRGNLEVGGDLTLVGGTVSSLGKLSANAGEVRLAAVNGDLQVQNVSGLSAILLASNNLILEESKLQTAGDLILLAGNIVRVRDSLQKPFLAQAGGNLYIQGNQGIDILALNHPGTPFQSGGNLSLVSDGIISGDAHFASVGNFSILNLSGKPGNFVSLYDPIISSEGDVILGDYTGVALKIEAKGSITTGNITITGADTTLTPGADPDITILRSSPALILRAGVDKLENPPTPINMPTPPVPPTPPQPPTPPSAIAVYENNFEDPTKIGSEWSNTASDKTPTGCSTCTTFLGQFSNDNISLTLNNLPAHTEARVSFDLFIVGAWDGNVIKSLLPFSPPVGPDIWELKADGSSRISTTFSNHGSGPGLIRNQSYPAPYNPSQLTNNPAGLGASETNTLGYPNSIFASFRDSVYKFSDVAFTHSNNSLTLNFSGSLRDLIHDESWGLDNVKVSILPSSTPPITPPPIPPTIPTPKFTSSSSPSAGTITAGNLSTPGGPIILSATSDINLTGSINSQGGDIHLNSGGTINSRDNTVDSSNSNSGKSGTVTFTSSSRIVLDNSRIIGTVTSGKGGDINLTAKSVSLSNNSTVITQGFDNGKAGNINITTLDSVLLSGGGGLFSDNRGSQPTGNINVDTGQLILQDGSTVSISTNSKDPNGRGGTVKVTAANSVLLSGTDLETSIPTTLFSLTLGAGDAGDIIIDTPRLTVLNGAAVVASTAPGSTGKGGNITANANLIEVIGTSPNLVIPSGFYVDTTGAGNAGNMSINSNRIIAKDGGLFSVSTFGKGEGGNLHINASESIELSGNFEGQRIRGGISGRSFDTGKAGNVKIETPVLTIQDRAMVSVSSQPQRTGEGNLLDRINELLNGLKNINHNSFSPFFEIAPVVRGEGTGDAGNIDITANSIFMNNGGEIIAETASGEGGNITLQVQDYSRMRNASKISTTAGNAQAGGNGGNITINTPFIIGISREDSDITANAYLGNGGRVEITAQGIYGLQFRPDLTPLSDITASSKFGFNGVVEINLPDIDPSRGVINVPTPRQEDEISKACQPGTANGEFVPTRRGGKPPHPNEALNSNPGWRDSQSISSENNVSSKREISQIVEAQGWVINELGEVVALVANPDNFTSHSGAFVSSGCGYFGVR